MDLSIIVNFYNMRREAERTLYSLTSQYQENIENLKYEVICLDHGSSIPINTKNICFKEKHFEYRYIRTRKSSPCIALNDAVRGARGKYVMICIDGARIFSPGLISKSVEAAESHLNPFVFTLNAHIGQEQQYKAIEKGYSQEIEDQLIDGSGWKQNGYRLFNISCLGGSASGSIDTLPSESNTPLLKKETYLNCGGFDTRFISAGGGLSNLEFFSRVADQASSDPILLIGEASFHQFHGGVITSATGADRTYRFADLNKEYQQITGKRYEIATSSMYLYGSSSPEWQRLIKSQTN